MALDPRLNAFRPDLADARLEGQIEAARFVAGRPALVARGIADIRRAPAGDAPLDAQLWYGERVSVFEVADGWAWIQAETDSYVGYTPAGALAGAEATAPSDRVSVPLTFRFPAPSIKAPPLDSLPMGALLRRNGATEDFIALHDGGYVFARHAAPAAQCLSDWAETASRFLGVPYLWGGRSFLGLDCSGLVQTALLMAGRASPRDTYQQKDSPLLGASLPPDTPRQRGDILFSPGHVVMALDGARIVHANAYHLAVAIEPFADFAARIAARGEAVSILRRPADQ